MELKQINWVSIFLMGMYQILFLICTPLYFFYRTPSGGLVLTAIVLFFLCGLGITAGYHRLYAHNAYKINKLVETLLLFFGTLAVQGSVLEWSYNHRMHHSYTDTPKDPYNIKRGFWYAHLLWVFDKKNSGYKPEVIPDLIKNKRVMFQSKYYFPLMVGANMGIVVFFGWIFNDYFGALVFLFLMRLIISHQSTGFVNSLAHTWGRKKFLWKQSPADNQIVALLTFGEGYHNYHHAFPSDYRNGIRWYHFDPSKWAIWILHILGLAKNLNTINAYMIKRRMIIEMKEYLLEKIKKHPKAEMIEQRIREMAERLQKGINRMNELTQQYKLYTKEKRERRDIKRELKAAKRGIREEWKSWNRLYRALTQAKPVLIDAQPY